jgi:hypothetical protein
MTESQTYLLKEFDKLNAEIAKLLEEIKSRQIAPLTLGKLSYFCNIHKWLLTFDQ